MITEEQFIRLFVEHEGEFRGFAYSLMLQRAEADDLLQEASIAMWRKIETLKHERAFRSWAYSYIRLTAMNLRRKRQRSPLVFSGELIEIMASEGTGEAELAAAERGFLVECIAELSEIQRDLLGAYYGTNRTSVADISKRSERTVAGIYKALERTRAVLRGCIEGKLQTGGFTQ